MPNDRCLTCNPRLPSRVRLRSRVSLLPASTQHTVPSVLPAQDDDWSALKTDFPRGSFVSVQDFSENHHHKVRNEPQAKYYQSVDSTLYMVVVRYHLDDAKLPDKVRDELRATYASVDRPPIIVETEMVVLFAFVSADRKHGNAFVRHLNDRYVVPYMQSIGDFNTHYGRSDGCKSLSQITVQVRNAI